MLTFSVQAKTNNPEFSYDEFISESNEYINESADIKQGIDEPGKLYYIFKDVILNAFKGYYKEQLKLSFLIILILIFTSILKSVVDNSTIEEIVSFGAGIILCLFIIKNFESVSKIAITAIEDLNNYMNFSFPGYAFLLASCGYSKTAASLQSVYVILSNIITIGINRLIVPFLTLCAILGISNTVTNSEEISELIKTMLKFIKYAIGIIITLFSAILGFTGLVTGTSEGVMIKTAKYAISNFVPLVGDCLADTLGTITNTSLVLKNTIGYIGIIVLLIICLLPIIKLYMVSITYKLLSFISSTLLNKNISNTLDVISTVVSTMGSVLILTTVIFILNIGIVLSLGV